MNLTGTLLILIIVLILIALLITAIFLVKKSLAVSAILKEEKLIVDEEKRLFSFLHDLGETISKTDSANAVYKLIVDGAIRVIDASGGAVFLWDDSTKKLVTRHYTDHTPPVIPLPKELIDSPTLSQQSIINYLRLKSYQVEEDNMICQVFYTRQANFSQNHQNLIELQQHQHLYPNTSHWLIAPMVSANKAVGVLALYLNEIRYNIAEVEFELFKSIAEQSAFAIANFMAHKSAQERKQIDQELRAASEIQRILSPDREPSIPRYQIAGKNFASRTLSGDFFDYINLDSNLNLGLVIADVSGKGTGAAIINAMCRSVLKVIANHHSSPTSALSEANRHLFKDIKEDMFITLIYAILESEKNKVTLSRAGHTLPFLYRHSTQTVETLKSGGLAIGIDEGSVFERVTKDLTIDIEPQDILLFYTDGVNEAMNAEGDEYGDQQIADTLLKNAHLTPNELIDAILNDMHKFLDGKLPHDDVTLLLLKRTESPST